MHIESTSFGNLRREIKYCVSLETAVAAIDKKYLSIHCLGQQVLVSRCWEIRLHRDVYFPEDAVSRAGKSYFGALAFLRTIVGNIEQYLTGSWLEDKAQHYA